MSTSSELERWLDGLEDGSEATSHSSQSSAISKDWEIHKSRADLKTNLEARGGLYYIDFPTETWPGWFFTIVSTYIIGFVPIALAQYFKAIIPPESINVPLFLELCLCSLLLMLAFYIYGYRLSRTHKPKSEDALEHLVSCLERNIKYWTKQRLWQPKRGMDFDKQLLALYLADSDNMNLASYWSFTNFYFVLMSSFLNFGLIRSLFFWLRSHPEGNPGTVSFINIGLGTLHMLFVLHVCFAAAFFMAQRLGWYKGMSIMLSKIQRKISEAKSRQQRRQLEWCISVLMKDDGDSEELAQERMSVQIRPLFLKIRL